MTRMVWYLAIPLLVYLGLLALLYFGQRGLLYHPSPEPPDAGLARAAGFNSLKHDIGGGQALTHWYRPPAGDEAPLVVLFQGNAGHAGHRFEKFPFLAEAGAGLLIAGYRGYGGNPGAPTEADLTEDAAALLARLEERGIAPSRTFLYGESLGTGLAVKLAAASDEPYAGVVLEAPYTSIASVAQGHYWYVPARWLVKDRWDAASVVERIRAPLLVLLAARDRVVPAAEGEALFERAAEPKDQVLLPEASHNDILDWPEAQAAVRAFVLGGNR